VESFRPAIARLMQVAWSEVRLRWGKGASVAGESQLIVCNRPFPHSGCKRPDNPVRAQPELRGSGRAVRKEEVVLRLPGWESPLRCEVPTISASR
jgi:hypothetical protein